MIVFCRVFALCFTLLAFWPSASFALEFKLDKPSIQITTGFNGDHVDIYGVKEAPQDIVIVVRGPDRVMEVRQKERVFGSWMNRTFVKFDHVPGFYRVGATKGLDEIIHPDIQKELQIGVDHLKLMPASKASEDVEVYKEALFRNKLEELLITRDLEKVDLINDTFFRASFYVPHNMPVGEYKVDIYAFDGLMLVDHTQQLFGVEQVGVNAKVQRISHEYPFWYGLLCVSLAMFAGWLSNRLKRIL